MAVTHDESLRLERLRVWLEHSCHPGACPVATLPLSLQVTLDLSQHQGIAVRRVLNTERDVVNKFGVTNFPSCYLLSRNGSFSRVPA